MPSSYSTYPGYEQSLLAVNPPSLSSLSKINVWDAEQVFSLGAIMSLAPDDIRKRWHTELTLYAVEKRWEDEVRVRVHISMS